MIETLGKQNPHRKAEGRDRRILVLDDDWRLREFNATVLTHAGYAVNVVEDGAAAWEAIRSREYDLFITDNDIPRMSRMDLIKKMRLAGTLPVILTSESLGGLAQSEWLESVFPLAKPYSADQLLAMVRSFVPIENEGNR